LDGRVGLGAACLLTLAALALVPASSSAAGTPGFYSFVSDPGLHPPKLDVLVRKRGLARGDFLVASGGAGPRGGQGKGGQSGPMIVDSQLQPVWFGGPRSVFDFGQQTYRGKPALVLAAPQSLVVLDEHYRTMATVRVRDPWMIDGHDASIVGGNIWVVVTRPVRHRNLTRYGGPRSANVLDCGLQEFRLGTGRLIRTWDALNPGGRPNVPLSASELAPGHARGRKGQSVEWDPYHLNSVQALPDGDLIVSMRDTWAVYLINPRTGRVVWTLGGKNSTFHVARRAHFDWQHDAELVGPGQGGIGRNVTLTLFNDNNGRVPNRPSSGMVLRLNTVTRRASLVRAYRHRPALKAVVEGSMQLLPNGNALVGWGSEPYFSEYSKAGELLLDVRWPLPDSSYRALFTDSWVGAPYYPPRGAVRGQTVYASWNGATQVAEWQVLAGPRAGPLKVVAAGARTGFETAIPLAHTYGTYEVRALRADGRVLETSRAFF
jgi:hypothetical protein